MIYYVDDNVKAAPIYRCNGKAGQPIIRPPKNHVLHMEWGSYTEGELTEATDTVQKQFLHPRSLDTTSKIQGMG